MSTRSSALSSPALNVPGSNRQMELIVCLDGSLRSSDALNPARALASHYRAAVSVVALHGDTAEVRRNVEQQLQASGFETKPQPTSSRNELMSLVLAATRRGAVPVISAFGRWTNPGRLHGVVGDLVRANVSRVLVIGPKVSQRHWTASGTIIESIDTVCRIEPMMLATHAFVDPRTPKILLTHVVSPHDSENAESSENNYSMNRIASKFRSHFDIPIETATIASSQISRTVGELARTEQAALIIARSWHRTTNDLPNSASTSLSLAADAPCPVLIVS